MVELVISYTNNNTIILLKMLKVQKIIAANNCIFVLVVSCQVYNFSAEAFSPI